MRIFESLKWSKCNKLNFFEIMTISDRLKMVEMELIDFLRFWRSQMTFFSRIWLPSTCWNCRNVIHVIFQVFDGIEIIENIDIRQIVFFFELLTTFDLLKMMEYNKLVISRFKLPKLSVEMQLIEFFWDYDDHKLVEKVIIGFDFFKTFTTQWKYQNVINWTFFNRFWRPLNCWKRWNAIFPRC